MTAKTWMCVDFFLAGVNAHGAAMAAFVFPNPVTFTMLVVVAVASGVCGVDRYREVVA